MHKTENKMVAAVKGGFTLVELLVVVAILGILGTIAVANVTGHIEETRKTAAKQAVDNIRGAVTTWMSKRNKSTPPNNLKVLVEATGNEDPVLEGGENALLDPWDHPYRIEIKGKRYVIISDGPDETAGTEDDIRSDKIERKKKD